MKVQRFVLHPLTALLFAFAVGRCLYVYEIVTFDYAWVLGAVFVFVGFLFLSRKYDPTLSSVFLGAALFFAYQAYSISENPAPASKPADEVAIERLTTLAARARLIQIDTGHLPASLADIQGQMRGGLGLELEYCRSGEACFERLGFIQSPHDFVIVARSKQAGIAWYVDESLSVYKSDERGDRRRIFP